MAVCTWEGKAPSVHQITTWTISSNTNGHTFILSAEHPSGSPGAQVEIVNETADGVLTTTQIAANIVTEWNASNHPFAYHVTASSSSNVVTFTADRAGVPFLVTKSGTGTSTLTTTTENSGPNVYSLDGNWLEGDAPENDDDVIVTGSVPILYGLGQSAITIDTFTVQNYRGKIGWRGAPLELGVTDKFTFDSKFCGECHIHIGSANLAYARPVSIRASKVQPYALYLTGGHASDDWTIECGNVALAAGEGETGVCGILMNVAANLLIGYGFTFTSYRQANGSARNESGAAWTDAQVDEGKFTLAGVGAGTTVINNGGEIVSLAIAGVTNWFAYGGLNDLSRYKIANSIGTLEEYPSAEVLLPAPVSSAGAALVSITTHKRFGKTLRAMGKGGFDTGA